MEHGWIEKTIWGLEDITDWLDDNLFKVWWLAVPGIAVALLGLPFWMLTSAVTIGGLLIMGLAGALFLTGLVVMLLCLMFGLMLHGISTMLSESLNGDWDDLALTGALILIGLAILSPIAALPFIPIFEWGTLLPLVLPLLFLLLALMLAIGSLIFMVLEDFVWPAVSQAWKYPAEWIAKRRRTLMEKQLAERQDNDA